MSVLVVMFVARDEQPDAVGPQDGIQTEYGQKHDTEHKKPVDAPHWDAE